MTRLKDIAERAGVSVMTVSKTLRDAPDISAATKARIRKLADQMGYMPDGLARGLRNRQSKLLGLLIPAVTNPMFARLIVGIEEQAYELGYDVLLAHSLNLVEREERIIRRLLSRRVDGLLLTPVYRLQPASPVYEELNRRGVPVVILGHRSTFCSSFPNVETDDLAASQAACRHLLDLGHRRIAFLAGPRSTPASQERFEGYCRALRELNLEVDDSLVFHAGSTIEEGEKAALQLMQEAPHVTAIQCVNDLVAIGAASVLMGQGCQIPEHVSVVGFGNILLSEHFRVPLTTVRQPKRRLGVAAMDLMTKLLAGQPADSVRLNAELVVRHSTAPPPAG